MKIVHAVICAALFAVGVFWLVTGDYFYGWYAVVGGLVAYFLPGYGVFLNGLFFVCLGALAAFGGNWKQAAVSVVCGIGFFVLAYRFAARRSS